MFRRSLAGGLATLLVSTACGRPSADRSGTDPSGGSDERKRGTVIAYSAPELVAGQLTIQKFLEASVHAKGWQLVTTTSGGDPRKQIEQIEGFLRLGVSAVVAVPDDSKEICRAAAAARSARVPFYTIDRAPIGCVIDMTVLSDNSMAGRQSAEALVELLTRKYNEPRGVVLELAGNPTQNVTMLRGGGFNDKLKEHPKIKVITAVCDWDPSKVQPSIQKAFAESADIDAIYLHSDAVYLVKALDALRALGRLHKRGEPGHVFLLSVDASPVALSSMRDGYLDQASSQPLSDFGIIVDWIARALRGEAILEGETRKDGAMWSPAVVRRTDVGMELTLSTTSVTAANVDHAALWANQEKAAR
jgi:simple sugar transport system substrate-binding protein/ribose transport system substrate-binding protein